LHTPCFFRGVKGTIKLAYNNMRFKIVWFLDFTNSFFLYTNLMGMAQFASFHVFFMLFHEGEGKNVMLFFRMGCPQRLHQNDVYGIKNVVL
jgi:hypothetical protein